MLVSFHLFQRNYFLFSGICKFRAVRGKWDCTRKYHFASPSSVAKRIWDSFRQTRGITADMSEGVNDLSFLRTFERLVCLEVNQDAEDLCEFW